MTRPTRAARRHWALGATLLGSGLILGCAPAQKHALSPRAEGGIESPSDCTVHATPCPPGVEDHEPASAPRIPASVARASVDAASCAYSGWSAPQPLAGVPAGSVIRSPSLAMGEETGYIVGNNIPLFDSLPAPSRPLIALNDEGEDIGHPAGDFIFAAPRALVDGSGTLHVVWAEPGAWRPRLRQGWNRLAFRYASLWHATYTRQGGWSPAEQVYASSKISWEHGLGDLALDPAAGLHGVTSDDSARALIHLSFSGGHWHARPVPEVPTDPPYSTIVASRDGRVYVAYVAADRSVRRDANSVFLVRSLDAGRTWLPPQLISRSGDRQATQIRALVAPEGTVHLVWAQNISGGVVPEVVRHVASRDGGETWSVPDDIDIPDGLGTLRAVADRCGAVHMTYGASLQTEEGEPDQARLWYARWNGGWSALEQPFGELNSTEAALETTRDGSPRLIWSVIHPAENVHQTTFSAVSSHLEIKP